MEALVVYRNEQDPAGPVPLSVVTELVALAGALAVVVWQLDLVGHGCGFVAELSGTPQALTTVAASTPPGWCTTVVSSTGR